MGGPVEVDYEPATLNEKTTQIAFRWLRSIRAKRRPLQRVDISSDSSDAEGGLEAKGELQVQSTKNIAYHWLGKVRVTETKLAWENDDSIVEDVAPKERMNRKKPKAKRAN